MLLGHDATTPAESLDAPLPTAHAPAQAAPPDLVRPPLVAPPPAADDAGAH
jgi:hypothetical protein